MANFVLSTHMTNGDVLPFLRLAAALRKRGHRATLVTHGVFAPLAEKAGIDFVAVDSAEEYTEIMKDLYMMEDPLNKPDLYEAYQRKYYAKSKFRREYEILSSLCRAEDSVLICKERDGFVAMMVSEKLRVPIVTGVLAPSYVTQLYIWEELGIDFAISLINTFRVEIGLQPVASWTSWMGAVKKNIGFWHESFNAAVESPPWAMEVETVGFPQADQAELEALPDELTAFIAEGPPPLLVTGGTGKMIKPNFYAAAIAACKRMKRRTIVVTRHEEFIEGDLPDYIRWYRVLPLASVYPLVAGVIHHGGIGTITGAMAAGTPQLALAADTDRPDNGMRIRQLGIGGYLPPLQWEPRLIAEAVEAMLAPSVKQRCLHLADDMRKHDTMAAACAAVESVVGKPEYAIASDLLRSQAGANTATAAFYERAARDGTGTLRTAQAMSSSRRALLTELLRRRRGTENGDLRMKEVVHE